MRSNFIFFSKGNFFNLKIFEINTEKNTLQCVSFQIIFLFNVLSHLFFFFFPLRDSEREHTQEHE